MLRLPATKKLATDVVTSEHLTPDQLDDALAYRLEEDAAEHLTSCHGCQTAVAWQRMAKLNQLAELENDWYCKTLEALAKASRQKGNGMVYAIPTLSQRSRLAYISFERPVAVKIVLKPFQLSLRFTGYYNEMESKPAEDRSTQTMLKKILRRRLKGETTAVEAAQQLVMLGYEPEDAWRMLERKKK